MENTLILRHKPKRFAPQYVAPTARHWALFVLGLLAAAGLAYFAFVWYGNLWLVAIAVSVFVCGLVVFTFFDAESKSQSKQMAQWAAVRHGEDVGDFARTFDVRFINTWVIRATYEELQSVIEQAFGFASFPVQAEDKLSDVLIDIDHFERVSIPKIERRTGRMIANESPIKINTVRELIMFINLQPFQPKTVTD